jgi:UDP-N-acetylmuramoyl-tripeptide--D-alanyl-D-alanine ligase
MSQSHPIPWTTEEIVEATRGELLFGDLRRPFSGVSIDSRHISADHLFVAIAGEVHDGHEFTSNVVDQGVRGLVISRQKAGKMPIAAWKTKNIACIAVEDTTRALGDMAAFNRLRSHASVVAITGSNGKTTTRRMTTMVLDRQYDTLTAVGNFNNDIGLPLTLLGLSTDHQWAILELGTNNPGEIARLAEICTPDIGVLTNIGPAHLEGLGSIEGVMQEKGDLLKRLGPGGKAILNADDARVIQLASKTKAEVILYGLSREATIRAEDVHETECTISFTLILAGESISVRLNSPGRFMVSNALAAAAVGHQIGLAGETVKTGLEAFKPVSGRMNIEHMPGGIHLIDDTYNANPESMKAAFATLDTMRAGARGVVVIGDMLELGVQAQTLHRKVGAGVARSDISRLCACGEFAAAVTAGARDEGMPPTDTFEGSQDEIVEDLKNWLQPGDWLLVKGSRGMAMEKVVQKLREWTREKKVNR